MNNAKYFAPEPLDSNPTPLIPPNTSFLSYRVMQKPNDFYILPKREVPHKLSIIRAEEMNRIKYFRDVKVRPILIQLLNLGIILSSALMLWKGLMCITGCQSPVVVVLTGSMEPGFKRGDILFLHMNEEPIRAGEIVVYNVDGRDIPIVHRVIKVHERQGTGDVDILTKGDNNPVDDISLYSEGQLWLNRHHIIGRAKGYLPYVGYITIIMTETPIIKYVLIGVLALLSVTSKD